MWSSPPGYTTWSSWFPQWSSSCSPCWSSASSTCSLACGCTGRGWWPKWTPGVALERKASPGPTSRSWANATCKSPKCCVGQVFKLRRSWKLHVTVCVCVNEYLDPLFPCAVVMSVCRRWWLESSLESQHRRLMSVFPLPDLNLSCPSGLSRRAGGCVWPLLGSFPRGALDVELHRPLVRAAPQGLRARPHLLRSLLLPELCRQPHPLQPHVHQVQRNVQSHDLFFQQLAATLQPPDDPAQHFERENGQQY